MQANSALINFGSGPAALPASVLAEAALAVTNYNQSGLSILEIPHRGELFDSILAESKKLVLELCALDEKEYEVLWLQGGGRLQFSMIPMNFLREHSTAAYVDSGHWAHDALENAQLFGKVEVLSSTRAENYTSVPELKEPVSDKYAYLHITTNNTIYGTQIQSIPDCLCPLFADMSSDIFSAQRDYSKFDLFYAVAQKNIGAAGNTLVVLRKNLLNKIVRKLPPILDYSQHVKAGSVLNTPPVFGIYVSLLTLRWIKEKGIENIEAENKLKADLLYREIERNPCFQAVAATNSRSKMNIVFCAANAALEEKFRNFAKENLIEGIAGHRSVGGFRVSLYNAIGVAQVNILIEVMKKFEQLN